MSPDLDRIERGVLAGDRALLGRALTLVESRRAADRSSARELLRRLLPHSGKAWRVGLSGVPGAGKSTLVDALGLRLTASGHRVAVLAVDPSSARSGGSILGDKTRMLRLANDRAAFIRPSPTGGALGGVARCTRQAMHLLEAAGFDVLIVETVGVGQSEAAVAQMVDCFLLLLLAGAGDELQGIKRGALELADIVAINKADGGGRERAAAAAAELASALRTTRQVGPAGWSTPVLTVSGSTEEGVDRLWETVVRHRVWQEESGELGRRRREQRLAWMEELVHQGLAEALTRHPTVVARRSELERQVLDGEATPELAATEILAAFGVDPSPEEDVG